jgi:hypothetical protein
MWRTTIICTALAAVVLTLSLAAATPSSTEPAARLRVGTYDNRAIAIAYGNSEFNLVNGKKKEYDAAKAAGDKKRIKELEEWGPRHQRQLHRQGFGRVPVTDLLEHVRDRLPEVAEVDITLELAMLFNPSKKALGWIEDMKDVEPLDLDEIEKHAADH